jgi:shikimate kinase
LIGYRGSGKSAVGRLLAERLEWGFLDADEVLEQRQCCSIRRIFHEQGEEVFRQIEASLLSELCELERHVIATGGGVVLQPANRHRLRDAGTVVWLKADPITLWQRIEADCTTTERRPNLSGGGLPEIETLLRVREPYYGECAHVTVDTVGRSPVEVAEAILEKLKE